MNAAETKISRARTGLVLDAPFFGTLALRLAVAEIPAGSNCETMATDGAHLFYAPQYVADTALPQLVADVAHEVLHCALCHHTRRGTREFGRWNRACDFAINPIIKEAGFALADDALLDPRFAGMSAEDIYAALEREEGGSGGQGPGNGGQDGATAPGEVWDAPGDQDGTPATPAEREASQQQWEVATLQAAQQAKMAGKLPGGIAFIAEAIRAPEVDWREALQRFMTAPRRDDYSWRRPNMRHLGADPALYLPSLYSTGVGDTVISIDVSGSTAAYREAFAAELNGILDQATPDRLHVVYWDAALQGAECFGPDDMPVKISTAGGGGTDILPFWAWLRAQDFTPECVVVLTDMDLYGGFGADPGCPVLWISTERPRGIPSFGEVVRIRA